MQDNVQVHESKIIKKKLKSLLTSLYFIVNKFEYMIEAVEVLLADQVVHHKIYKRRSTIEIIEYLFLFQWFLLAFKQHYIIKLLLRFITYALYYY